MAEMTRGRVLSSIILLVAMFALTVASFIAARVVSETESHGIRDAAESIAQESLSATAALSEVRTELREINAFANELTRTGDADPRAREIQSDLQESREEMARTWTSFLALPIPAVERELSGVAESNLAEMNVALDDALRKLGSGDREGGMGDLRGKFHAANARADEAVRDIAALSRQRASDAADRIVELRQAGRSWGIALDAMSALFAMAAVFFVIRVGRRYWVLVERRTSELEHFTGRIAHDIRGPLGTVGYALDIAKHDPHLEPATRATLDRGIRTVGRIGDLVDGLLVFAMAGRPAPGDVGAKVGDVLPGVLDDLRPVAEATEIDLVCEPPDPALAVACSAGVLVSMTSNLVGNAIKFMGDSARREVRVHTRDLGRTVRVEVEDTGPGVPPELRSSIFLPHVRAADAVVPGFGLGLATVRQLAEGHGGKVGLESDVGAGSRFWFELPKVEERHRRRSRARAASVTAEPATRTS
jgi:signal transduction histidine kinase